MKRFCARGLIFVGVLICLLCMGCCLLNFTAKWRFRISDDVHTLYLGNSLVALTYDDKIISHSFNFGKKSDQLEFIYAKLKLMKEANPQIDTVFVGLDNSLLFKPYNFEWDGFFTNNIWFMTQFDLSDWKVNLRYRGPKWRTGYVKRIFKYNQIIRNVTARNVSGLQIGGYDPIDGSFPYLSFDSLEAVQGYIKCHLEGSTIDQIKSRKFILDDIVYYLRKIEQYCLANGIKLYFISSPKTPVARLDDRYLEFYRRYFPEVSYYDFSSLTMPDSCFYDYVHLNRNGAELFSKKLRDSLLNERNWRLGLAE